MDMLDTPFLADLRASVEVLYQLAPDRVPPTLMVCHCSVCMTRETLAQIVATPVRDLPPNLIQEYSNSAHGDPVNPDDLSALLPRYLDLIAQDVEVDWNSVGADLKRFGDARLALPGFPPPGMAPALDRYARLLILHFGALQARDAEVCLTPWHLMELLLVGGWQVATLAATFDELFADPEIGRDALIGFLLDLAHFQRDGRIELWALSRYRTEIAADLAAFLNRLLASDAVTEVLTAPDQSDEAQIWLPALVSLKGRITAEMFVGPAT
jgi:hypothetical protein